MEKFFMFFFFVNKNYVVGCFVGRNIGKVFSNDQMVEILILHM